jgi:hypothetical protein
MANKLILNSIFLYGILLSASTATSQPIADYLLKPTGQYNVAFKDFHWVNHNICPDSFFSQATQNDFSSDNKKHCHELMIRIYYPTTFKTYAGTPYYQPIVEAEQKTLKAIPNIKLEDIKQLAQLKSHTIENAPIIKNIQFPAALFIGGSGGQVQLYENVITQLVSNGYIVVGINSVFNNGDIALPNNRIVNAINSQNWNEATKKTIPALEKDISFVYLKIHDTTQDSVFKSIDLKHIGAVGHSFGGRAIANVANQHKKWFQALVTFDMEVHMGSFKPKNSMMPTMHIISAYWRSMFNWQHLYYQLNKNGYLVTLSPTADDKNYSYHMNFTIFSTLQYMPAYQASLAYDHSKLARGEDVIIKTHVEKIDKFSNDSRPLYLIVKNKNVWKVFYYDRGKKVTEINLENIPDLQAALDNLSLIKLKKPGLVSIKKIIHAYHQGFGNFLGNGNGLQINKAINLYLVDFFNTFLKSEKNPFKGCTALTSNTYMVCGPGIF